MCPAAHDEALADIRHGRGEGRDFVGQTLGVDENSVGEDADGSRLSHPGWQDVVLHDDVMPGLATKHRGVSRVVASLHSYDGLVACREAVGHCAFAAVTLLEVAHPCRHR